jgi:hypothetical protein
VLPIINIPHFQPTQGKKILILTKEKKKERKKERKKGNTWLYQASTT